MHFKFTPQLSANSTIQCKQALTLCHSETSTRTSAELSAQVPQVALTASECETRWTGERAGSTGATGQEAESRAAYWAGKENRSGTSGGVKLTCSIPPQQVGPHFTKGKPELRL